MIAFGFPVREKTYRLSVLPLAGGNEFVSIIDGVGDLDGKHCLIDWKTTTSRYMEAPEGLPSLDPQLIAIPGSAGSPTWPL
jgi:hypothetical protein